MYLFSSLEHLRVHELTRRRLRQHSMSSQYLRLGPPLATAAEITFPHALQTMRGIFHGTFF